MSDVAIEYMKMAERAFAQRDMAVEALRAVEWRGHRGKCPLCAGWAMSDAGETPGKHTKDCLIGKTLSHPAITR